MLRQMVGSPSPSQPPEPTPLPEIIYVQYDEGGRIHQHHVTRFVHGACLPVETKRQVF